MCGIAGFAGNFDQALLQKMGAMISHRGPDDDGSEWFQINSCHVGLVHRRLSIIDLSPEGKQPLTVTCNCCNSNAQSSQKHKLLLVYNGELYNYRELRDSLIQKGHVFRTKTDSEVLLHLYAQDGPDFLKQLNGIFAFAIYDGRLAGHHDGVQSGDILLARDGVGVKPLYYSQTNHGFVFASELKALLANSAINRELDFEALHYYLAYLWCPAPLTPLKQIKKFLPGEAMIVRNSQIAKQWIFYDLPYQQNKSRQTEAEIADELIYRLEVAVKRQLIADVPVGAFLSGGLDSSAIVAMMRQLQPENKIQCYSIGFSDSNLLEGSPSDLPYAKRVAKHLGVDLKVINLEADMIQHLSKMIFHLDEPQADPAPINALLISEQAGLDGIKVLLSGAGGDDIFSGYRRHYALQSERYWEWWPMMMKKATKKITQSLSSVSSITRRIAKACAYMDSSSDVKLASYFLWSSDHLRMGLYSDKMNQALGSLDTLKPLFNSMKHLPHHLDRLDKMLYLECKHFLADHNLNYTDKVSMAAGVEVRVPLLDPDLMAFAAGIPVKYKQKGRIGKAIFKKAMEAYLPKDVIYRPKTGFGAPIRHWMNNELHSMIQDVLSSESLRKRELFDPIAVEKLIRLNSAGKVDGAYTIFSILCIELWSQMFVDKAIPAIL